MVNYKVKRIEDCFVFVVGGIHYEVKDASIVTQIEEMLDRAFKQGEEFGALVVHSHVNAALQKANHNLGHDA